MRGLFSKLSGPDSTRCRGRAHVTAQIVRAA